MHTLDLNGTWKARWASGQRGRLEYANREQTDVDKYIDAVVPGEIHLDLWRAGIIADPYIGTNVLAARWVEEMQWAYRREFDAPAEPAKGRAWLVFEGLDYAAVIFLNGQEVGRHCNVFYPCRIDVTGKLKPGKNLLTVHLDSGLWAIGDKPGDGYGGTPDSKLHKRHWLRKPQCQFEWDWSPRLINVGIFKPVRLEWTDAIARMDQLVPLAELSADLKRGSVRTRLFVEGLGTEPVKGQLTVEIGGQRVSAEVQIKPGLNPVEATITIENPKLWWPLGHGPQELYTVKAVLTVDGKEIGQKTARVGFRHVRVNQDPHPVAGRHFIVEINGRPIFCKGGNLVPADMIFARLDRERYERLTDLALEQNFNFLRVWGGGLYESDDFYELCDEKGILVWQEFIFACAKYPGHDEAFLASVKAEARHNIRRLASHASLVVWCGNNEIEWGHWHWGYEKGVAHPDYAIYHLVLPRLLSEEDPTRFYQPSSPFSPEHQDPMRDDMGDQHPWSIGFADTDFRKYRSMICRFPNEGGTLGPTALPTMLACLPEGQRAIASFAWEVHENSIAGWQEPSTTDAMLQQWLGRNIRDMSVEEFCYWGGLVQGEGLKEYCDSFRRRMFDTSSAIFWMYNDTWPAVRSWTTVDYYLRRTPASWAVKRSMAPVHVVVAEENAQVVVFGINETQEAITAELRYGVFELAGGYPVDEHKSVTLAPNASTRLASFDKSQWKDSTASAAFAMLMRDGTLVARNRLFLPMFKELKWSEAKVRVKVAGGQAVFSCDTFAWGVCIDLDGETALADNFFDLYPGVEYAIAWGGKKPPTVLHVGNLKG